MCFQECDGPYSSFFWSFCFVSCVSDGSWYQGHLTGWSDHQQSDHHLCSRQHLSFFHLWLNICPVIFPSALKEFTKQQPE